MKSPVVSWNQVWEIHSWSLEHFLIGIVIYNHMLLKVPVSIRFHCLLNTLKGMMMYMTHHVVSYGRLFKSVERFIPTGSLSHKLLKVCAQPVFNFVLCPWVGISNNIWWMYVAQPTKIFAPWSNQHPLPALPLPLPPHGLHWKVHYIQSIQRILAESIFVRTENLSTRRKALESTLRFTETLPNLGQSLKLRPKT